MIIVVDQQTRAAERVAIRSMFEARKRVFIDLLKWDLPVLAKRFEVDQFDDVHAIYVIIADNGRQHLASARLLPTTRPGILNSLYPMLCESPPPCGSDVYEITRFCLSRELSAADRRVARDRLVTALARFAVDNGIRTFTGVAEMGWLRQILRFGWACMPLGLPQMHSGRRLGALRIDIDGTSLAKLERAGIRSDIDAAIAA